MGGVMYTVYAKVDSAQVWSDSGAVHKAGRVPLGEQLEVVRLVSGWYEINRPANISLPVQPSYPRYFIDPVLCQNEPVGAAVPPTAPPVTPPVVPVAGDAELGAALRVVLGAVAAALKGAG